MSAQTRNDSRYERQAHAHLLQAHDLTTSAKGGASCPAPQITTCSQTRYKLPTRLDIGSIRVAFEPSYEPTGPFGAKSIGEVVINTPLAAVASAVAHATGHQVRSLPITPEKALLGE